MTFVTSILAIISILSFLITLSDKLPKWNKYILWIGILSLGIFIGIIANAFTGGINTLSPENTFLLIKIGIILSIYFSLLFFIKYQIPHTDVQYFFYSFLSIIILFIFMFSFGTINNNKIQSKDLIYLIQKYESEKKYYDEIRILKEYIGLNEISKDKILLKEAKEKLDSIKKLNSPFRQK